MCRARAQTFTPLSSLYLPYLTYLTLLLVGCLVSLSFFPLWLHRQSLWGLTLLLVGCLVSLSFFPLWHRQSLWGLLEEVGVFFFDYKAFGLVSNVCNGFLFTLDGWYSSGSRVNNLLGFLYFGLQTLRWAIFCVALGSIILLYASFVIGPPFM